MGSPGICLHLGEADLLPADRGGRLPLVFSMEGRDPLSAALQEGDALVEIDGMSPEDWSAAAARLLRYGADPEGFDVATAPQLPAATLASGSTLTFARCDRTPPDLTPCTEGELELLVFDMWEIFGDGWRLGAVGPFLQSVFEKRGQSLLRLAL